MHWQETGEESDCKLVATKARRRASPALARGSVLLSGGGLWKVPTGPCIEKAYVPSTPVYTVHMGGPTSPPWASKSSAVSTLRWKRGPGFGRVGDEPNFPQLPEASAGI